MRRRRNRLRPWGLLAKGAQSRDGELLLLHLLLEPRNIVALLGQGCEVNLLVGGQLLPMAIGQLSHMGVCCAALLVCACNLHTPEV